MKLRPVRQAAKPNYPDRLAMAQGAELLREHLPCGWKKGGMAGALALFVAANISGCQGDGSGEGQSTRVTPTGIGAADEGGSGRAAAAKAVVAPIFKHGEGRGAVGCVVIAPPSFLSEEEALQIIREELGKVGVELTQPGMTMPEVVLRRYDNPRPEQVAEEDREAALMIATAAANPAILPKLPKLPNVPLTADLGNKERRIAVEYVSADDAIRLYNTLRGASVTCFQTMEVAGRIAEQVAAEGREVCFGAFYDPHTYLEDNIKELRKMSDEIWDSDEKWKKYEAKSQELRERQLAVSKDLLRQQVQDFITWLKVQEVIR